MKYSRAVEHACCIMALIAGSDESNIVTNEKLSSKLGVSPSYLKKITHKLARGGLITASYGARGGFTLARTPRNIRLYDVVVAIEGEAPLFQPTGLIEQVFRSRSRDAEIGLTRIEKTFADSEQKAISVLKQLTLESLVKEIHEGAHA